MVDSVKGVRQFRSCEIFPIFLLRVLQAENVHVAGIIRSAFLLFQLYSSSALLIVNYYRTWA